LRQSFFPSNRYLNYHARIILLSSVYPAEKFPFKNVEMTELSSEEEIDKVCC